MKHSHGVMKLTGLFLMACLACLSYITQDHLPTGGTAPVLLVPFTSVINQENTLQTCVKANLMEPLSQLWLFFLNNSSLCQLVKNLIRTPNLQQQHFLNFCIHMVLETLLKCRCTVHFKKYFLIAAIGLLMLSE